MYITINKTTQESAIFKEKSKLSLHIGKSVATIYRNKHLKSWETLKHTIYNPQIVQIKSNRGGLSNFKRQMFYFGNQNQSKL